jgi:glycerol-3-phosphate acyltransferase PlsY
MHPLLGVLLAYLAGSIPFAYLAGKALRGIDLREHGSGNLGATNVVRVMGAKVGAVVFALDVAKGALPVVFLPRLTGTVASPWWPILFGVAAIVGHVRPVWFLGKGGGKGVATAAGVFLALAPAATLVAFALWAIVLLASGYVSLASLAAAAVLPIAAVATLGTASPVLWVSVLVAAFVFWTHRANIGRLRRGEEHRFGRKKPA